MPAPTPIADSTKESIRIDYASGDYTQRSLATKYNVCLNFISLVINHKQHVPHLKWETALEKLRSVEERNPGTVNKLLTNQMTIQEALKPPAQPHKTPKQPSLKSANDALTALKTAARRLALFEDEFHETLAPIAGKAVVINMEKEINSIIIRYNRLFKGERA